MKDANRSSYDRFAAASQSDATKLLFYCYLYELPRPDDFIYGGLAANAVN